MGAESVYKKVKSTKKQDIIEAFKQAQEYGIYMHGHDPYNGTFSTIDSVRIDNKTFTDSSKAYEYCLDNAEKWSYAVAVTVDNGQEEPYTIIGGWAAC